MRASRLQAALILAAHQSVEPDRSRAASRSGWWGPPPIIFWNRLFASFRGMGLLGLFHARQDGEKSLIRAEFAIVLIR